MKALIGKNVDRYHILEQLGRGGMATVYKASDTRLERNVAIKLIRKEAFSPEVLDRVLKRFEREAKALARLSHTHIINVFDYGEFENSPYLVMEYLPGGTLKEKLGKPMPPIEAVRLLAPIAQALAHAHQEGIVHRDIKPSNILIDKNGAPKLTDFGIARILEMSGDSTALTGTGVGVGTPEYMAPEQGLGKEVDARTDIYALGVVLYEMVTGTKPYQADTPMAVVVKHINDPLPRPSSIIPGMPVEVDHLLIKALAKEPENRYADMATFAKALEKITSNVVEISAGRQVAQELTYDELAVEVPKSAQQREKRKPNRLVAWLKGAPKWGWVVVVGIIILVGSSLLIGRGINGEGPLAMLATPTATSTLTITPSPTPTFTSTNTATPTYTSTSSLTPTITFTSTPNATSTYTITPTSSSTPVPTGSTFTLTIDNSLNDGYSHTAIKATLSGVTLDVGFEERKTFPFTLNSWSSYSIYVQAIDVGSSRVAKECTIYFSATKNINWTIPRSAKDLCSSFPNN